MCGRAYETYTDEELYFRYRSKRSLALPPLLPNYNLCPTETSPVLRFVGGEREFEPMHWQLIFASRVPARRAEIDRKSGTGRGIGTENEVTLVVRGQRSPGESKAVAKQRGL